MKSIKHVDADTLREWLETGKEVTVLDVRPQDEWEEWQIPGSLHIDAYKRLKAGDSSVMDEITIPRNIPVVTVCAAGNTSKIAARSLEQKGMEVYSLENGMKGWSLAWNKAVLAFDNYQVIQLRRTGKGCLSYIIASNNDALIIDASLPAEVYEGVLLENNFKLKAVIETHIHADHLSRSKQLAEKFRVPLLLPVPNKVVFAFKKIEDGDLIDLGSISIKVIATPGHTIESVSLLASNQVLFKGDTLFTNAVGRPDLRADEDEAKTRAGLLYDSLQKLIKLDERISVFPAHASSPIPFDGKPIMATLLEIKKDVSILRLSKEDFIKTILAKLPPAPANYQAIVERNLMGSFSDVNPIDLEVGANRCAIP